MTVKVSRTDAVAVAEAMGHSMAKRWNKAEMKKRLEEIAELGAGDKDFRIEDDGRLQKVLEAIIESGGDVELVMHGETEVIGGGMADAEDDGADGGGGTDGEAEPDEDGGERVPPTEAAGIVSRERGRPKGNERKPKAVRKSPEAKGGRPKVLGRYSAGPFVRWLGRQGVGKEGAAAVLAGEGVTHLSEASVGWELNEHREGREPASVTADDAVYLRRRYPLAFGGGDG